MSDEPFGPTVPDAATEEAFKKAVAFDKAVALSERRQTLLEEAETERDAAEARVKELEAGDWECSWEGEDQASPWLLNQVFQSLEDAQRFAESTGGSWVKRDGGRMVRRHVGPWVPVESEGE